MTACEKLQNELRSTPPRWFGRLARAAEALVWLSAAGLGLALIQQFHGGLLMRNHPIGPAERISADGMAWRWRLPDKLSGEAVENNGVVLEDGVPLSRSRHASDVTSEFGGHYHFRRGILRWAASDGSDVRTNGRRYELRAPDPVSWWKFAVLGGTLALSLLTVRFCGRMPALARTWNGLAWRVPGWAVASAVMVLALVDLRQNPDRSDGALLVKGIPESDAQGWHMMATSLAEGAGLPVGFDTQRPFFSVLLGGVYAIFGVSLAAAKVFNALLLACAVAAIMGLSRSLRAPWAGLAVAAFLALSTGHRMAVHAMITENAGLAFGAVAAWSLAHALGRRSIAWCALTGLLVGAGNLASGVLLLTVPLYAAAVLFAGWRESGGWRRSGAMMLGFALGVCLVFLPWMFRQKAVHGVFTLSLNSAELLAGGADAEQGRLTKEMHAQAEALGYNGSDPAGRYRYFMERFRKSVSADPPGYAVRVAAASWKALELFEWGDSIPRTLVALVLCGAAIGASLRRGAPQPLALAPGLLLLWNYLAEGSMEWLVPVSFAALLVRGVPRAARPVLLPIMATLASALLLAGLSGNVATRRFWLAADWVLLLPTLLGTAALVEFLASLLQFVPGLKIGMIRLPPEAAPPPPGTASDMRERELPAVCSLLVAFSGLSLLAVLLARWRGPVPVVSPASLAAAVGAARTDAPEEPGARSEVVWFDDFIIHLRTGEDVGHWLPIYQPRHAPVWLAQPRYLRPDGILGGRVPMEFDAARFAGPPPRGPALVTGVVRLGRDPISGGNQPLLEARSLKPLPVARSR